MTDPKDVVVVVVAMVVVPMFAFSALVFVAILIRIGVLWYGP
jgi:hypothetical protein